MDGIYRFAVAILRRIKFSRTAKCSQIKPAISNSDSARISRLVRLAATSKMTGLRPLITICGTTGVGKSKLAIELALKLAQGTHSHGWKGARIINADSMQVYTGMDVITNKVPVAERMGVEHLLMDFKQPGEQYVVGEWVQDAIQAVNPSFFSQSLWL
jgi:hypothetical protein